MKSEWRTIPRIIDRFDIRYRVYRLIDAREPDHAENREYWSDKSGGSEQWANRLKAVLNYEGKTPVTDGNP